MSSPQIHPTAIVDRQCELSAGVEIGPYCVLNGPVKLGEGVRLLANVHVQGPAEIGARTILYPNACVGFPPQDYKFKPGDPTAGVRVGSDCILRESITINAATKVDVATTLGDRVFMMVGSHVGHDARVGSGAILVNAVLLGGHSQVGDNATLSGGVMVHQFGRVGRLAFISGGVAVAMDMPPFCISGLRNTISGINVVGLRRAGVQREEITKLRHAFREVFRRTLPRKEMVERLEEFGKDCPLVREQARFVAESKRSVAFYRGNAPVNELVAE